MPETRALKVSALALAQAGPRSIPRRRDGGSRSLPRIVTSSATNPRCAGMIFWSATRTENHSARSTSGNCCCLTAFGGHTRENRLLCSCAGSQSPSTAQAWTTFFAQNGPPGCTSSTSGSPFLRRNLRRPALVFAIFPVRSYFCHTAYPSVRSSRANAHAMRCASAYGKLEHGGIELDHVDVVSRDLLRHAHQSSSGRPRSRYFDGGCKLHVKEATHDEGTSRRVQRRRDRDPDHDHGAGAQGAARHGRERVAAPRARVPDLRAELRHGRHLLEQPPSHAARRRADQRQGDVGEPAPPVLAVAHAIHHRLDGREPFRAPADGAVRRGAPLLGHRVHDPSGGGHRSPGPALESRGGGGA